MSVYILGIHRGLSPLVVLLLWRLGLNKIVKIVFKLWLPATGKPTQELPADNDLRTVELGLGPAISDSNGPAKSQAPVLKAPSYI